MLVRYVGWGSCSISTTVSVELNVIGVVMEIDWYRVNDVKKGNDVDVVKDGSENRSLRNTVVGCAGW